LIDRPSTASAASPRTSDSVGWAWVDPPISQGVASRSKATDASAIRSVACGPMMWIPRVSSVSLFAMTFAKPSYSPPMIALAIAWNGTLPTLIGRPRSSHCCCVSPIEAISGRQYVARGCYT